MEIRIVIFLAFVSVVVVGNTLALLFAYKAFAGVTTKVTQTVSEFSKSGETRYWIDSLQDASKQAAELTETTKQKIAEIDPLLSRAQDSYRQTLANMDSTLDKVEGGVNTTAEMVRDMVAKPAFSFVTFAAGIAKMVNDPEGEAE
jgi:hypothetical protein